MQSNQNNNDKTQSYSALVNGTSISHYTIVSKLGSGGMGEVYLADDHDLGRQVALKFLPDRLLDDERAKARFRREAQATAQLNHPNIVTIHEVGEHKNSPFFAMEFVEGKTLEDRLSEGLLSPEETTSIIIQVARGLQEAHQHGIIHRDIKPGNICICNDGRVKILDFGLARMLDRDSLTKSNMVLGTLGYNSPEQIRGDPVDGRTDIWSLGVLICRMLTRKLPFEGDDAHKIMYSITHSRALDISEIRKDIPFPILMLYRRCLEKKPGKRPQSMSEVLNIIGVDSGDKMSMGSFARRQRSRKLLLAFLSIIFVVVCIWVFRAYLPGNNIGPTSEARMVGILPFHNNTSLDESSSWPEIIQVLFVGNLTGFENIGIFDPLSLNAIIAGKFDSDSPPRSTALYKVMRATGINYVIDGMILKDGGGYKLQANIIDPRTGQVVHSCAGEMKGEENLPVTVASLSNDMLEFFQTRMVRETFDKDIKPWVTSRTYNLEALKAFMQANEFIFNGLPGSERYLKHALELDSTFVAARIYLISGLAHKDHEAALSHYNILLRDEQKMNPFERAMTSWAGGLIKNDLRAQVSSLKLALEYSPGNNILLFELARDLYALGELESAEKAIRPAVDNKWKYSPAYYLQGLIYCKLDEYSRARKVLEESLNFPPVYEYTYGLLVGVSLRLGNRDAAQRYEKIFLHTLEEKGDDSGEIYASLGDSHASMDLGDDAIRCYRLAVAEQPDSVSYHSRLGALLYDAGQWHDACDEFLAVLDLDSQNTGAYLRLAVIHDTMSDTSEALKYYKGYIARDSLGDEVDNVRARIMSLQKQ